MTGKLKKVALTCLLIFLTVLFVGELAGSLRQWHRANHSGMGAAALHSLAFLAFFWMSLLLLTECFSHGVMRLEKLSRATGVAGRVAAGIVVSIAWNIIAISAVMYFSLGCYLNLSLLRFACTNMSHGFFQHLVQSQQATLVTLVIFLAISTIFIFVCAYRTATWLNFFADARSRRIVLMLWLASSVGFTMSVVALNHEQARALKVRMMDHLSFKLDPLLNFGLNCYDFYRQSRYESLLLEESDLTPRSVAFLQPPSGMTSRPNIVFFQIESFRGDLIGQTWQGIEVVPNLNRLARAGTTFVRGYAGASHTSLSNPSIPSSLYPLRTDLLIAYKATDPWPKMLIWDVLKPYGYSTAYIASDIESWCGMDDFLITSNLDIMVDATSRKRLEVREHPEEVHGDTVGVKLVPDRLTAQSAIAWMYNQLDAKKPFYITISLSDSHFPYRSSITNADWFKPAGVPPGAAFNDYPRAVTEQVRNSYMNAIHGVDQIVGQILAFLDKRGAMDNTIFVVYGDHGESFYENGFPSHANLPYDPSVRTCLIMSGKSYFEPRIEQYPASLIDVVPTVLARVGLKSHPNFQGIDVLSTNRPPAARRCLYIHVDGLVNADGLLAGEHWKYFEDNGKGDHYLYDLAHDPGEQTNLVDSKPELADFLSTQLANWRTTQLTYYRSARYYTRFYPPPPKMLPEPGLP